MVISAGNADWAGNSGGGFGLVRSGTGDGAALGANVWAIFQNGPNDPVIFTDSTTLDADTWYHIAMTRTSAGLYKMFQDGVLLTNSWGTNPLGSVENLDNGTILIGGDPLGVGAVLQQDILIDEFRITKGTAIDFASVGKPTQTGGCS